MDPTIDERCDERHRRGVVQEFTISRKNPDVFFSTLSDVTMATTTEGVAGGRHHVCVLVRLLALSAR